MSKSQDLYEYLDDWYYVLANANELGQLCPGTDIEKDLRRVAQDRINKTLAQAPKRDSFGDGEDGDNQYLWNLAEFLVGSQRVTDNHPLVPVNDVPRVRKHMKLFGVKDVVTMRNDPDRLHSEHMLYYIGEQ